GIGIQLVILIERTLSPTVRSRQAAKMHKKRRKPIPAVGTVGMWATRLRVVQGAGGKRLRLSPAPASPQSSWLMATDWSKRSKGPVARDRRRATGASRRGARAATPTQGRAGRAGAAKEREQGGAQRGARPRTYVAIRASCSRVIL